MATIERRDLAHVQSLCGGDHRCIHRAKRQVAVRADQLGDAEPVLGADWEGDEVAGSDVSQEADLRLGAESSAEQVDDLCDDELGYQQRPGMCLEQLEALVVV